MNINLVTLLMATTSPTIYNFLCSSGLEADQILVSMRWSLVNRQRPATNDYVHSCT